MLTLLVALAGCTSGPVEVDEPAAEPAVRRTCAELVASLPQRLADQERRETDSELAAAWGDPAIVLRCGVPEPAGFDELSTCHIVNDVAWWIPEQQVTGEAVDLVMTTIGREPGVEVTLPAAYFPPAAAMAQLSDALTTGTTEVEPCG